MIKYILIFLFILILLYCIQYVNLKIIYNILFYLGNIKINIKNSENLKYINERVIIMSNHYCPCDVGPISYIFNKITKKQIYTVSRQNIFSDKNNGNMISKFLSLFDSKKFFKLISYEKGNKKSGKKVKEKMVEIINNNDTVILFPEGDISRKGISSEFKPGSFKMCSENNIKILPITLDYNKRIGRYNNEIFNIFKWYNTEVTITIHKPIYNEDPEILQKITYNTIVNPLIQKYKERNIIN